MLKVLDVDGAVRRVQGGWEATGQPWAYDAERYDRVREAREREQQAMLDYLATDACRMRFLRDQLDDPDAAAAAAATTAAASSLTADGLRRRPSRRPAPGWPGPGVAVEPRKMWPTALANLGHRPQGQDRRAAPPRGGRSPGSPTSATGSALRELFAEGTPDGPGAGRWRWLKTVIEDARRVGRASDAIVHVESAAPAAAGRRLRRPGCRATSQVPVVGRLAIADPSVGPGRGATNSAQRVAAVARRYELRGRRAAPARCCCSTTWSVTGWTLTVAALALREAGATAVLPVALGTQA